MVHDHTQIIISIIGFKKFLRSTNRKKKQTEKKKQKN